MLFISYPFSAIHNWSKCIRLPSIIPPTGGLKLWVRSGKNHPAFEECLATLRINDSKRQQRLIFLGKRYDVAVYADSGIRPWATSLIFLGLNFLISKMGTIRVHIP